MNLYSKTSIMEQTSYVHDCLNNLIFLEENVLAYDIPIKLSAAQYLQSAKTITSSTIIVEADDCLQKYYYSSFGLYETVLVGVHFKNGIWKVGSYYEDPSAFFLLTLFKKHLRKGRITMFRQSEHLDNFFGNKEVAALASVAR